MNPTSASQSPVLFIIFNRPDTTAQVFAAIRGARPPRLYVAADGARSGRQGEDTLCLETRRVATLIDWPCELKTLFRDKNLGCREAVSSAIDWFFANEEEGIILEDDCVPVPDFFRFCHTLLAHYRHDTRIRVIGGSNLQRGQKYGDASYYFSELTHVWGWASWRRVWADYDKSLSHHTLDDIQAALKQHFAQPHLSENWFHISAELKAGKIDTWDFQLALTNVLHHGLTVIPAVNLVANIGFDDRATHTRSADSHYANLPTGLLPETLIHPPHFVPNREADAFILNLEYEKEQKYREMIAASQRRESWWQRRWRKLSQRKKT